MNGFAGERAQMGPLQPVFSSQPKRSMTAKTLTLPVAALLTAVAALFPITGCDLLESESDANETELVYPMYVDANENGVNDYVEEPTHEPGSEAGKRASMPNGAVSDGPAPPGHAFMDENGDGICDFAQNGSATWHGPGFVDEDGDGICDYWDEDAARHGRHRGLRFRDEDDNDVNDYVERPAHRSPTHEFVDEDGDGICDLAQDGSPTWHGPGYVDENGNGRYDHWEPGGRGHGGPQGGHGRMGGMNGSV